MKINNLVNGFKIFSLVLLFASFSKSGYADSSFDHFLSNRQNAITIEMLHTFNSNRQFTKTISFGDQGGERYRYSWDILDLNSISLDLNQSSRSVAETRNLGETIINFGMYLPWYSRPLMDFGDLVRSAALIQTHTSGLSSDELVKFNQTLVATTRLWKLITTQTDRGMIQVELTLASENSRGLEQLGMLDLPTLAKDQSWFDVSVTRIPTLYQEPIRAEGHSFAEALMQILDLVEHSNFLRKTQGNFLRRLRNTQLKGNYTDLEIIVSD